MLEVSKLTHYFVKPYNILVLAAHFLYLLIFAMVFQVSKADPQSHHVQRGHLQRGHFPQGAESQQAAGEAHEPGGANMILRRNIEVSGRAVKALVRRFLLEPRIPFRKL